MNEMYLGSLKHLLIRTKNHLSLAFSYLLVVPLLSLPFAWFSFLLFKKEIVVGGEKGKTKEDSRTASGQESTALFRETTDGH